MLELGHIHEAEQLLVLASLERQSKGVAGLVDLRVKQGRKPEVVDLISEHIQKLRRTRSRSVLCETNAR